MFSPVFFFVISQALGACVGAGMAVWGELAYLRAIQDGNIDIAERKHLDSIARGLRFGMTVLLLSSFALVIISYASPSGTPPAFSASYWTLIALALLIIVVAWALSRRRISFVLASTALFTAWWFLVFLTLGQLTLLSFGAMVAFFVVAAFVFHALLQTARHLALRKNQY